ncbi:MAG: radical SAM protein, partial [Desulfobacteraceae bacterium]
MSNFSIKSLASGGVITNYYCVSCCGHCLYNCGPHREKGYLDERTAERVFQHIVRLGCRSVHIGGGEPLLNVSKLINVLNIAYDVGVGIDYVETNSAWFIDSEQAVSVLTKLQAAGVHTLLISISPFHNAYVPFTRVMGVIDACRQTGMNVFPWVNAFVRDLSALDNHRPHTMEEFIKAYGSDYLERIAQRYWIHLGGRALKTFRKVYPLYSIEEILAKSPLSCARSLMDTSHFHMDFNGNYIPGLCVGLAIDMEDLGHPLPSGKYSLLDRLAADGIRGLYELAGQSYGYTPFKSTFLNHCDLCTDIRNFLIQIKTKQFYEL